MVRIFCTASLVLAAVSAVSGHVIPHKRVPPGWETEILQNYEQYHSRYLAWDCEGQHNTTFFEKCCHPLLTHESLDVLTNLGCKAPSDDGCDDGESPVPSSSIPSSSSRPAYTTSSSTPPSPSPSTAGSLEKSKAAPAAPPPASTERTSTAIAAPTKASSSSPAPAATDNGGSENSGGVATFFFQNGVAGACGTIHSDSDFIAAIDQQRYGNSGNSSPLCGKQVHITNTDNGKVVVVTVADDCPTCENSNSIDLSQAAFNAIAEASQGEVPIEWFFL